MAGHSKWKTIKHKKAAADAKRGKAFTKLIKEISIAAREGGGKPESNPRLRTLLEKAKEINMPQENSQRAIKKGTGELPGQQYEQHIYEGYGPGGIAVIIDVLTDNSNRAISELRHMAGKKGGNMAESGAVMWMFEKLGVVTLKPSDVTEDDLLETLMENDVQDISVTDGVAIITCSLQELEAVKKALSSADFAIDSAEIEWVAKNTLDLSGSDEEKALEFLHAIEDLEDVQNVYTNLA